MAESIGALRVEVSASIAQFEQNMAKAGSVLGKWTEGNQRSAMAMSRSHDEALKMNAAFGQTTQATGSALGNLAKIAVTMYAVKAAVGFVTDSLKAQSEQEAAINKLNQALANQGTFTDKTSQSLIAYSAALQDVSTFSDEVILDGMALLASFGLNEIQIKAATKASLDYAAATGKNLNDAMMIVGKAFAGNTKALGQLGIVIDKTKSESERLDSAVTQLAGRFGGQALAATKTYEGGMAQLKNQFGEVQESFGKFLGELAGSDRPFGIAIDACKSLADFLGKDLVIALSEIRAQMLEFFASIVEGSGKLKGVFAALQHIPGLGGGQLFKDLLKGGPELAASLRTQADEVRKLGDESAASAGKIKGFTAEEIAAAKAAHELAEKSKAAAAAAAVHAAAAKKQAEELKKLAEAAAKVAATISGATVTWTGFFQQWPAAIEPSKEAMFDFGKTVDLEMANAGKSIDEGKTHLEQMTDAIDFAVSVFDALGVSANSALGRMVSGLVAGAAAAKAAKAALTDKNGDPISWGDADKTQKAQVALAGLTTAIAAYRSGAIGGALAGAQFGAQFGVIGAAIGAAAGGLLGWIGGMGRAREEAMRLANTIRLQREEYIRLAGGIDALKARAAAAGISLTAMLNARTVADYEAAIRRLDDAFALFDEARQKTQEAADRYGLTLAEMGPAWASAKLDEKAAMLLQDYRLLIAAGADNNAVIAKMGPAMNDYVNEARAAGVAIPEAMRPVIMQMIEQGLLLDENGVAFEDLESTGITFAESMSAQFQTLIDKIDALVSALLGIPNIERTVNVRVHHPDGPIPGGGHHAPQDQDPPEFAGGGIGDFGAGTLAVLHGREMVVPLDGGMKPEISQALAGLMGSEQQIPRIDNYIILDGQQMRDWIIKQQRVGALTRT